MELREIIGAHDPDKMHAGNAAAQVNDRVDSITRADDSFETADIDTRIVGDFARGLGALAKGVQSAVYPSADCLATPATTRGRAAAA